MKPFARCQRVRKHRQLFVNISSVFVLLSAEGTSDSSCMNHDGPFLCRVTKVPHFALTDVLYLQMQQESRITLAVLISFHKNVLFLSLMLLIKMWSAYRR